MGLDISHGAASWGYIGFHEFRKALARHEGLNLDLMRGFGRADSPPGWRGWAWDSVTTPLKPLLNHSDCDGVLTPEECAQVAPRLREVIEAVWPQEAEPHFFHTRCRQRGLSLADAMDRAAEAGEDLEFF